METEEVRKNKIDLKYQTFSSLGLKALGLAVSVPLALAGISFFQERTLFVTRVGAVVFSLLLVASVVFLSRAWSYMEELEEMAE